MKSVWKYQIAPGHRRLLDLPLNAEPLSVGVQDGTVVMWCLVNPEETFMVTRQFTAMPTGDKTDDEIVQFVGTFSPGHGDIFHLFEVK